MRKTSKTAKNAINIVGASAGSGKTHDLCQRYHTLLTQKPQGTVRPEHILATTFTRKAAGELRQRLRQKLLAEGRTDLALAVEDGRIGTVHSVCLELLSQHAFLLGISPELVTIPEDTEDWAFDLATSHILEDCRQKYQDSFRRAWPYEKKTKFSFPSNWDDAVKSITKLARANDISPDALRRQAEQCWARLAAIFDMKELTEKKSAKLIQQVQVLVDGLKKRIEDGEDLANIQAGHKTFLKTWRKDLPWSQWRFFETIYPELTSRNKTKFEAFKEVRELAANYISFPQFRKDLHDCITAVFHCAAQALEEYKRWKESQGLIDYNDMEAETLALLTGNATAATVADTLKGRVKQIFVDEFQDTSPMQLQLFLKLSEIANNSIWIGDTKQAIYGFRGTDPELMQVAAREIEKQGGLLAPLQGSWRSRPCLVEFTNTLFEGAFPSEKNVVLEAHRVDEAGQAPDGLRYGVLAGTNEPTRYQSLAEGIAKLVASGNETTADTLEECKVQRNGQETDILQTTHLRPIGYGDIAVLCRGNETCKAVAKALGKLGIPAQLAPEGMEREPLVRLCLGAYHYTIHPEAALPLLEMARLLGADMDAQWLSGVLGKPASLKELPCLQKLLPELEKLHKNIVALSPSEALRRAIIAVDKFAPALGAAATDSLLAKSLAYEERCRVRNMAVTHDGCLQFCLDENSTLKQQFETGEGAVSVITYHAAKGLEWPVVFAMPYALKGSDLAKPSVLPSDSAFELHNPLKDRKIQVWPVPQKNLPSSYCDKLAEQDVAIYLHEKYVQEELRLLYVGLTRARDILVLVHKSDKGGTVDWIGDLLRNIPGTKGIAWSLPDTAAKKPKFGINKKAVACKLMQFTLPTAEELQANGAATDAPVATISRAVRPQGEAPAWPPRSVQPSTDTSGEKGAVTLGDNNLVSIAATPFAEDVVDDGDLPEQQRTGAERGTIFHNWLALAMVLPEDERPARAAAFAKQWGLTPAEKALLLPLCVNLHEGLRQLPVAPKLGTFLGYRTEWPLAYARTHDDLPLPAHSLVNGEIDLLAIYKKGTIIVDHKFTQKTPKEAVKHYAPQLAAYREGLTCAGGFGEIHCCLHMPKQGVLVVVE